LSDKCVTVAVNVQQIDICTGRLFYCHISVCHVDGARCSWGNSGRLPWWNSVLHSSRLEEIGQSRCKYSVTAVDVLTVMNAGAGCIWLLQKSARAGWSRWLKPAAVSYNLWMQAFKKPWECLCCW